MSQFLEKNPEYLVAEYLEDNWGSVSPSNAGYTGLFDSNDTLTDDEFPISTSWNAGDRYPLLTITNNDPNVPGGGNTNITGLQGDGSGPNQERLETMLMTVQASEDVDYNNDLLAHDLIEILYNHASQIITEYVDGEIDDVWDLYYTPATHSPVESNSTVPTHQYQGSVTVHWQKEP